MIYTCGYWKAAKTLEEAQISKLELIAQKLSLSPGMTVLDIGCGWGGLCAYLAKNYGVTMTGITVSKEQVDLAKKQCEGLAVDIQLMDYRDHALEGKFDRVVAVGMMEAVGRNNFETFFKTVQRCLKPDGIFLLHTIGRAHHNLPGTDPWAPKYIFPNGYIPYYKEITDGIEKKFIIEDWGNFGADYAKTLSAWWVNFDRNWPTIEKKYGPGFYRMWKFYLQSCQAYFEVRQLQLWQIVLSKEGIRGGYYGGR